MLEALRLAKMPEDIINSIEKLTKILATQIHLNSRTDNIVINVIKYLCGVIQEDNLSVLSFILSINSLSFLLKDAPRYKLEIDQGASVNVNHSLFVDDLKLYATLMNNLKLLLDIITKFSKDNGMTFGLAKCAYMYIERGKRKSLGKKIDINRTEISELEEGDMYKYLGVDEGICFGGPLNKEKIRKAFLRRTRKIWESELHSRNKVTACNTFALPVLTMPVGVLDWNEQELKDLDVKTRKYLNMSGSLHSKGDIDHLYVPRSNGGRGLNSVMDMFKNRMANLSNYLQQTHNNPRMETVKHREGDNIIRIGNTIRYQYSTGEDHSNEIIKNNIRKEHYNSWTEKVTHGFLQKN